MRYCYLLVLVLLLGAGCQAPSREPDEVVARVGSYAIGKEEFDEAFKASSYAAQDNPSSRQAFLENMINQKLILLEAQAQGLDKDKEFLKMIENFWQQSLLTVALQSKSAEGGNLDQWVAYLRQKTNVVINGEYLK